MREEKKQPLHQGDPASPDNLSGIIKEKFLAVANDKANLEAIILEQNDIIKKLEKDNATLAQTLREYGESHKKMKAKLLDFDILRNMEISEMKKKIETLLSENKKLTAEKDLLQSFEHDGKTSPSTEEPKLEASLSIAANMQSAKLSDTVQELKDLLNMKDQNLSAAAERLRQLEQELSSADTGIRNIEGERNSLKNQMEDLSGKLELAESQKMYSEEELDQEIDFYSKEILRLKSDTEMLISSIKEKVSQTDGLNQKVSELSKLLSHKDFELHEAIPLLQARLQKISDSIDKKAEENSVFTKTLAELNEKLSALTEEMVQRDETILEISEDYKKEKESWADVFEEHESAKNQLESELATLKAELDGKSSDAMLIRPRIGKLEDEKLALESRLSTAAQKIEDLEAHIRSNLAVLESKDQFIMETHTEVEDLKTELAARTSEKQVLETEKNQLENQLAHLQAKFNKVLATDSESRHRIGTLEDDKIAIQSNLSAAMQKIEDLEANTQSNLALFESKEEFIFQITTEIEDLKAELLTRTAAKQEIEAELADLTVKFNNISSTDSEIRHHIGILEDEKLALESDLSASTQKFDDLEAKMRSNLALLESKDLLITQVNTEIEDLKAELASLNTEKQNSETEKNRLETDLTELRAELEGIRQQGTEYRQVIERAKDEKIEFEDKLSEARQKITDLEDEISRHVSAFSSHEQLISDLKCEIENYLPAIESLREENTSLKDRLSEKEQEFSSFSSEKSELLKKITILEEAFKILRDDATKKPADEAYLSQKPSNIVPVTVSQEKKSAPMRYAVYAVILIAVVVASLYISKFYQPAEVFKQRPAVTVNAEEKLSYNEIYDRNTRTAASKNIKLQTTIITESLLSKGETTELSGFDFNKHVYFKISINSLEGALDQALMQNPLDSLKLTEDSRKIDISGYKQIDKIKTFYKRQAPIAITFYCVFPKSALGPDRKDLTLSLTDNGVAIPLVWDIQTLIANKI